MPQGVVVRERVTIPEKEGCCSRGTEEAVVTNEEMDVSGVERGSGGMACRARPFGDRRELGQGWDLEKKGKFRESLRVHRRLVESLG